MGAGILYSYGPDLILECAPTVLLRNEAPKGFDLERRQALYTQRNISSPGPTGRQ